MMSNPSRFVRLLGFAPYPIALVACVTLVGCGDETRQTGTTVTTPPEQVQANNQMEEFMKKNSKNKKGGGTSKPAAK